MAVHDTIGDFLTMIRNASLAGKPVIKTQYSKVRFGIAKILKEDGYIADFSEGKNERGLPTVELKLKYVNNTPAITGIERVSKPGRRLYSDSTSIPRVLGGLGVAILTTSKGIMDDKQARRDKVGGELICKVW